MDASKAIKYMLVDSGVTEAALARRVGLAPQNLNTRLKSPQNWRIDDLAMLAGAVGAKLECKIVMQSGESIEITPNQKGAAPAPAPKEQPPEKSPEVPAPEQAARKSPEPPKREQRKPEDLDALIEQKQRKLAEQVAEMQRKEEARAAKKAKEEAERQKLLEETQEAIRQYAIQFNREQARLAGEGKKFKEWDDLYDQNRNDILHAAKFRDYREVFTLQELTPRERMARGFPMFDEEPRKS